MLFRNSSLSLIITLAVVAFIFLLIHRDAGHRHPGVDAFWLVLLGVALCVRLAAGWLYRQRPDLLTNPRSWMLLFRSGVLFTAAAWGAAGVLYYPGHQETMQVFTILVVSGVTIGALSVLATDYPTYRAYVLLSMLPLVVMAVLQWDRLQLAVAALVLLAMVFLLRSARHTARSINDSLKLRYANAGLLAELEQEKQRLINEAETRIGSILNSAPIALWAIDRDGLVTFMDGQRLQRQTGVELPRIGDRLVDCFSDHPAVAEETQRALQGEQFSTEIAIGEHVYEVHYSPLLDERRQQQGAIGVAIDISERKRHEQELTRRANYDELTGLANRSLAMDELKRAFARARRNNASVALYFLDLDNFKAINDTLGHRTGDRVLCQAASRLQQSLRATDFAARVSGDEFLVIAEDIYHPYDAEALAHKIVGRFHDPFILDARELVATTSVGIAIYPRDAEDAEQLLQCADTAMYHAKGAGKNSYRFFTRAMQETAARNLTMETQLRRALERNELQLYYQPKIDTQTNRINGAEALLRWDSQALGRLSPDQFIPVAELAGMMPQIGEWVLRSACREAALWSSICDQPIEIAINISPQQFRKTDLLANVTQALVESGLSTNRLQLEITESLLVQDAPDVLRTFNDLRSMGISLALDDFGTGYSSLAYLRKFPLQALKIDKSFVQGLGRDRDSEALVHAIIAMAQSLRLQIVAEGVETAEQLEYLKAHGVELVQGYLFSRPLPAAQFREMLRGAPPLPATAESYSKQEGSPLARSG